MKTHTEGGRDAAPDRLTVGLSEWRVVTDGETLVSHGVGASVAVALYDPGTGVGGLARAALPREAAGDGETPGKYADAAVRGLAEEMIAAGASYAALRAWLVGGSAPFSLDPLDEGVGERAVEAAAETLDRLNVAVVGRATGGARGRTVALDAGTGEVTVRRAFEDATVL
jgi:chemotaxis protein CheD